MIPIPMVDLQRQYALLKSEIDRAIQGVVESSQFILGPEVSRLEGEIAAFHGVPFALGVASGTDALLLALKACGVGPGDEVITSPFTFVATAEAIVYLQATPVFSDISPDTFNLDPGRLEAKITHRTKAIIPIHLYGHAADMDPILALARRYGLKIIEDCAQAFGAEYHGRKVGTIGDCGCFSFFPSKNLGCYGDGGMVITSDGPVAEEIKSLRNHGSSQRYVHHCLGYNSRLDEVQAAVLRVKLRKIEAFNEARRRHAESYRACLKGRDFLLPQERAGCRHVYHQFTMRTPLRDRIMAALAAEGIASAIYYPLPLHRQPVFSSLGQAGESMPVSEFCAAEVLSLPMFPELQEEEIALISHVINNVS